MQQHRVQYVPARFDVGHSSKYLGKSHASDLCVRILCKGKYLQTIGNVRHMLCQMLNILHLQSTLYRAMVTTRRSMHGVTALAALERACKEGVLNGSKTSCAERTPRTRVALLRKVAMAVRAQGKDTTGLGGVGDPGGQELFVCARPLVGVGQRLPASLRQLLVDAGVAHFLIVLREETSGTMTQWDFGPVGCDTTLFGRSAGNARGSLLASLLPAQRRRRARVPGEIRELEVC